ncbi:MAG: gliding motility lipoprotein GldH [Flavobacteriales bacterium]|nr:gliding motility lipoprotein GldH [Flavobacteriales bacterium]MCX7767489.1 gliding motility lipoprotein GldH [Flavobacteriales bacterium]MDW8409625.1 gliding motility lipoprotein GldH [Flavobacteriales bacterium]
MRKKRSIDSRSAWWPHLIWAVACQGCGNMPWYEKTVEIKNYKWHEADTLHFRVEKPDTNLRYRICLGFRVGHTYPFSNLYVFFLTRFPDSRWSQDTLHFLLSDKRGKPTGECAGKVCDYYFILRDQFKFPQYGDYIFSVVQAMRTPDGTLPDVRAVYLKVEHNTQPSTKETAAVPGS